MSTQRTVFGGIEEVGICVGYNEENQLVIADDASYEEFDGTEEEAIAKAKEVIKLWEETK